MTEPVTTHAAELEVTLASDPALSGPEYAATLKLARDLAAELDRQTAADAVQSRTVASYAGLLGTLRRAVRDERERRRREGGRELPSASRLRLMQEQARGTVGVE